MTDQPTNPTDRTAELEARIAELERRTPRAMMQQGRSGLEEAFWATMHRIFPDDARKHLKSASREQLMAARVYLDKWIARLDKEEAEAPERPHERIDVE
jgi:hypothetical protein